MQFSQRQPPPFLAVAGLPFPFNQLTRFTSVIDFRGSNRSTLAKVIVGSIPLHEWW